MLQRLKPGIVVFLALSLLFTVLPLQALAESVTEECASISEGNTPTSMLQIPIGLQGFEDGWDSNPDALIEIAVQFMTPSAVALRLEYEEELLHADYLRPLLESISERQALTAHDEFQAQIAPLTSARNMEQIEVLSEHYSLFNGVFLRVPVHTVEWIAQRPEVFSVTPNTRIVLNNVPAASYVDTIAASFVINPRFVQESRALFHMDYIHNVMGITGDGIRVAVLDSGVDYTHPELVRFQDPETGRIRGINFSNADGGDPDIIMDRLGHGTHVTGIVAAMAPNVELWHYKVFDNQGRGDISGLIGAMEAAHEEGVDVINLSLGIPNDMNPFQPLNMTVNLLVLDGIVVVTAAGNFGTNGVVSPSLAGLPISVASGTAGGRNQTRDTISSNSSRGANHMTSHIVVDITAPGQGIYSAWPGGRNRLDNGTSMAAPHIAGIVALLLEQF
ncbi:MAG: S8 family serine peptidase, partial [Oscillospiraceae bacterium]|nr:S8 family serine peptidase [Oscillospiraceae bacterium]